MGTVVEKLRHANGGFPALLDISAHFGFSECNRGPRLLRDEGSLPHEICLQSILAEQIGITNTAVESLHAGPRERDSRESVDKPVNSS